MPAEQSCDVVLGLQDYSIIMNLVETDQQKR
jgi:hypothetical protein